MPPANVHSHQVPDFPTVLFAIIHAFWSDSLLEYYCILVGSLYYYKDIEESGKSLLVELQNVKL